VRGLQEQMANLLLSMNTMQSVVSGVVSSQGTGNQVDASEVERQSGNENIGSGIRRDLKEYRGRLPKVEPGSEENVQGINLINAIELVAEQYEEKSLVVAIRSSLNSLTLGAVDPGVRGSINDWLGNLKRYFSSKERVQEEEDRLKKFRIDQGKDRIEQVQLYLNQWQKVNLLIMQAGVTERKWNTTTLVNHLTDQVLREDPEFGDELSREWERLTLEEQQMITSEGIRALAGKAAKYVERIEDRSVRRGEKHSGELRMVNKITTLNRSAGGENVKKMYRCWRCDELHEIPQTGTRRCVKEARPKCDTCGREHLGKFHEEAERAWKRVSFTQGGSGLKGEVRSCNRIQVYNEGRPLLSDAITISIGGIKVKALLDSGADMSVIHKDFWDAYLAKMGLEKVDSVRMEGVTQEQLDIKFAAIVPIVTSKVAFEAVFQVVGRLSADVIIGNDCTGEADLIRSVLKIRWPETNIYENIEKVKSSTLIGQRGVVDEHTYIFEGENEHSKSNMTIARIIVDKPEGREKGMIEQLEQELEDIYEGRLRELAQETSSKNMQRQREREMAIENQNMKKIIKDHALLFAKSFEAGTLKVPPVDIELNKRNPRPIVSKLKPLAHSELKIVEKWIGEALDKGIIEESSSVWRSTVFPVPKPPIIHEDGKIEEQWRIVTPFFGLNGLLNVGATPIPHMEDIQTAVAGANWFTTLDLRESFFQIPLAEESRPLTAFAATGTRLYQYKVVPMGCAISTGILQSALTRMLQTEYFQTCICYADDILIYSRGDMDQHLTIVKKILHILNDAGAKIKLSKVRLAQKEVDFLGMRLSEKGWQLAGRYKDAVAKAQKPTTITSLRSFLGLTNWQRRFISNYSDIARPLTDLTKKTTQPLKDVWTVEHQATFEKLQQLLSSDKVLVHPDFTKDFHIYSDASDYGIGGCLCQEYGNIKRPIGYFSRKLRTDERKKGIPEKETMALVESMEEFRPFIFGYFTVCHVDQQSVKWLLKQEHPSKYVRYRERISPYKHKIEYVEGKMNIADWMSRHPLEEIPQIRMIHALQMLQSHGDTQCVADCEKEIDNLDLIEDDPFFQIMAGNNREESGPLERFFKWEEKMYDRQEFAWENEEWMWKGVKLLAREMGQKLISKIHAEDEYSNHQSVERTMRLLRQFGIWPKMRHDVTIFIDQCDTCKKNKGRHSASEMPTQIPMASGKFRMISVDFWGFGALPKVDDYQGVLSIVDRVSNLTRFLPMKGKTAKEAFKTILMEWITIYGFPESIHADNEFSNELQDLWTDYFGINSTFTAFYAPFQNGQVERIHRFLAEHIRLSDKHITEWPGMIKIIAAKYNAGWCSSINESPFFVAYGVDFHFNHGNPRQERQFTDAELLKDIEQATIDYRNAKFEEKLQAWMEKGAPRGKQFKSGDIVWWNTRGINPRIRKFDPVLGPYRIIEHVADNLYILQKIGSRKHEVRAAGEHLIECKADHGDI